MAGWLVCVDPDATDRRFILPDTHINVLANPDSMSYLLPFSQLHAGTGKVIDQLVLAYRNNTGVSWDAIGDDARESQANLNRPFYLKGLPALLEKVLDAATVAKLHHSGGKIADVGAGFGWSSIGLAQYFGATAVHVYDRLQRG